MITNEDTIHSNEQCFQKLKRDCPANKSLHGETHEQHVWSGWPGAYCLKCGDDDVNEVCLALSCECLCHNELWEAYEQYCNKTDK